MAKTRDELWAEKAALDQRRATLTGVRAAAARVAAEGNADLAAKLAKIAKTEAASIALARKRLIKATRRELRRRFHTRFDLVAVERAALMRCRHGQDYQHLWTRLENRPSTKPMPAAAIRVRADDRCRRRRRTRAAAATMGAATTAEPDPNGPRLPFFEGEEVPMPSGVLRRFERTRAWALLPPLDRRRVVNLLRSGNPAMAGLIEDVFATAALARNEHPGCGDLWIGPDFPVNAVLVRDRGGLWRVLQFGSDAPDAWVVGGAA